MADNEDPRTETGASTIAKFNGSVGGFLRQFESQTERECGYECECESEFELEFPFLSPAACAPCQEITRPAAFCYNNRRCLA